MNVLAIKAIYRFEMARWFRTLIGSLATPVITTSLYFVVFGSAMASQMRQMGSVPYGLFIVPGLIMMALLTQSISNASFGIYMPRFTGTIFEVLSAPVSAIEMVIGYVGAAATKSIAIALMILLTSTLFTPLRIDHPFAMLGFVLLTSVAFSLFGFLIGLWAGGFEHLQIIPTLVITPLTFLGGAFYPLHVLPEPWRTVSLFNPVVYLISALRWAFFSGGDVSVGWSLAFTAAFLLVCLALIGWVFKTGWRLKN